MMVTDDERREVARMADRNAAADAQFWKYNIARAMGMNGRESDAAMWHRFADLIDPDTATDTTKPQEDTTKFPDAKATAGGWTVKVYDPEGMLVSPSLTAQCMVEMMASCKVDRSALLALADEMDELCGPWHDCGEHYARSTRKAIGVDE